MRNWSNLAGSDSIGVSKFVTENGWLMLDFPWRILGNKYQQKQPKIEVSGFCRSDLDDLDLQHLELDDPVYYLIYII